MNEVAISFNVFGQLLQNIIMRNLSFDWYIEV